MAQKGQIIRDPHTGEWLEFLETAAESGGRHTRFLIMQKAGGFKPALHYHTEQEEAFEVRQGTLTVVVNGEKRTVATGESVVLPRGRTHTHYNEGAVDLITVQTLSPALDFDLMTENFFGLSAEGKVRHGQPQFLQLLLWLRVMKSKAYLARHPRWLQDALAIVLTPVARLLGYQATYRRFSGVDR